MLFFVFLLSFFLSLLQSKKTMLGNIYHIEIKNKQINKVFFYARPEIVFKLY